MSGLCLFDLDHTLLPLDSDHAWGEFLIELGWVDEASFRRGNDAFYAQYQAGTLDIHAYIEFSTAALREHTAADCAVAHDEFMRRVILPVVEPQAVQLVRSHQQRGDRIALVTATNDFITAPIARAFGIDSLLAVELDHDDDGRPNGRIRGTPSFREGKLQRVEQWLHSDGATWGDFDRINVYSDSMNDLALLERASEPVATNPSADLAELARSRGWRILQLFT